MTPRTADLGTGTELPADLVEELGRLLGEVLVQEYQRDIAERRPDALQRERGENARELREELADGAPGRG